MERVILIQPPWRHFGCGGLWGLLDLPFGLLATSILVQKEFLITIIDCRVEGDWQEKLIYELKKKPLCVGISVIASQVHHSLQISRFIKQKADIPVVWGGVVPRIVPELVLNENVVDIAVLGEGEITFYELCKALRDKMPLSGVLGIAYKETGKVKFNAARPYVNLDNFAKLPFHLIDMRKYEKYLLNNAQFSIETSRSCVNQCSFCINAIDIKNKPGFTDYGVYRAMSPHVVYERLEFIIKNYKVKTIHFIDENPFCDLERFEEISAGIIDKELDFQWSASTDPRQIPNEKRFVKLLKDSGCTHLNLGVDSGSPRIRQLLNRNSPIEDIYRVSDMFQEEGMKLLYFFMSGLPSETEHDLKQTVDLMLDLLEKYPQNMVSHCTIYCSWPNTPLFSEAVKQGLKIPERVADYDIDPFSGINFQSKAPYLDYLDKARFKKLYTISLATLFLDNKIEFFNYPWWVKKIASPFKKLFKYRLKNQYFHFNFEPFLFNQIFILFNQFGLINKLFKLKKII